MAFNIGAEYEKLKLAKYRIPTCGNTSFVLV